VLKYLLERRNHPSIDSIYRALLETLPGLSKASVYNSIGALENAGLVRSLALEGCEMRYDAFTADHGHFKCEHCGEVFDIDTEIPQLPAEALDGFLVRQRDLFIRGLCPECRAVIRQ
jgi:Fur family peroxide stress response transcriptional regulator